MPLASFLQLGVCMKIVMIVGTSYRKKNYTAGKSYVVSDVIGNKFVGEGKAKALQTITVPQPTVVVRTPEMVNRDPVVKEDTFFSGGREL